MSKKVMNIVNFVRGIEPRWEMDLFGPIKKEIDCDKKYDIPHTFLLQYDALVRKDIVDLFLAEQDANMELGVWIECCRELVERTGESWRGREGYDWDWYADVCLLDGYEPVVREQLIDLIFNKFNEVFGYYPQVVGAWILDNYSMDYIQRKYSAKAFCICREQYAVDAYTLWGGYYNGGFYPSKKNMLCPAQTKENQIDVPTFRMLGIDPIYCYDEAKHQSKIPGGFNCFTMEPSWAGGKDPKILDWYFETYYRNPCLSFAHATTGQENSFGWENLGEGYCMQIEKLTKLREDGVIVLEKLGETGENFKRQFEQTPASALCALSDWSDDNQKSIWYNCKYYRANLFLDKDKLYFRDINKFDENYESRYLWKKLTQWASRYDNLPVVDGRLWRNENEECNIEFHEKVGGLQVEEIGTTILKVIVFFENGKQANIIFSEEKIEIIGFEKATYNIGQPKEEATIKYENNEFFYVHNDYAYSISLQSNVAVKNNGYDLLPVDGEITLFLK